MAYFSKSATGQTFRRASTALWLAAACASVGRPHDGSAAAASAQKPVLLTFDDGPDPVWTPRILKVLHSQHVHAVLSVTGEHASISPALIRQIVADGDTLCVHSWDHPHMLTLPAAAQHREIARTQTLLESLVGTEKVRYWRAPYGQSSAALDAFARTLGLSPLGWNAEGLDSVPGITSARIAALEAANLTRRPLRQWARPPGNTPLGIAVVLLHDAQGENAAPVHQRPGGNGHRRPGTHPASCNSHSLTQRCPTQARCRQDPSGPIQTRRKRPPRDSANPTIRNVDISGRLLAAFLGGLLVGRRGQLPIACCTEQSRFSGSRTARLPGARRIPACRRSCPG